MGRSLCRQRKRNKKSKARKIHFKKQKCRKEENAKCANIFSEEFESENCNLNIVNVSQVHQESAKIELKDLTETMPEPSTCSDTELEAADSLLKRNANWCYKTYIPKFAEPKENPSLASSGIMDSDEYDEIMSSELPLEIVQPNPACLTGNRIVDLGYVLSWSVTLQYKHSKVCTLGQLFIKKEIRKNTGMSSIIVFGCNACATIYEFSTEDPKKAVTIEGLPNKSISNVTSGAVWGTLATGSTYGHMQETFACMDIPTMSDNIFYSIENCIGEEWEKSLWRSFEAAGVTERQNAMEKGQVSLDGVPWITVYVDGSWSKRSYGTNFNSLSGMVGIIGKFTGELLFVAVRNRFCSICTRATNNSEVPAEHVCYKNWTASAPAMESNMVVEGFNLSEIMHKLRYLEFIADGDSSVFKQVKENVSYGAMVQKVECTNHAIKNYGKNLRKIKTDKQISVAGKKLLTIKKIDSLTKRAKCSISEYATNNVLDVAGLRTDLRNGLHHVFGDHSSCRQGICNSVGDTSSSLIQQLKEHCIYNHIDGTLTLLVRKAHLLIQNENNNRAERLMNIVARFNMGKRLNLSQRGSYKRRVHLASLRYNKSFQWHFSPWKRFTGASPGKHFQTFIQRHLNAKVTACKRKLIYDANVKHRKTEVPKNHEIQANTDYGKNADEPDEEPEDLLIIMEEAEIEMNRLQITAEEIRRIQHTSVGQFSNSVFLYERQKRLTASLFGRVIKRRPYTPCHNVVKACLRPASFFSKATEYGIAKENVAIAIFEEKTNQKVNPSGFWIDEKYGFLGASPDGLIGEDALVEVKCIYAPELDVSTISAAVDRLKSRICLQKSENGEIHLKHNHAYYYQIQGQLNITRRDKCFLIVYINDTIDLFIEEIGKDETFWKEQMLPPLVQFYRNCVAPELVRKNLYKNKTCVDPPYILHAIWEHDRQLLLKAEAKKAKEERKGKKPLAGITKN